MKKYMAGTLFPLGVAVVLNFIYPSDLVNAAEDLTKCDGISDPLKREACYREGRGLIFKAPDSGDDAMISPEKDAGEAFERMERDRDRAKEKDSRDRRGIRLEDLRQLT